jgi:hypothetical protein
MLLLSLSHVQEEPGHPVSSQTGCCGPMAMQLAAIRTRGAGCRRTVACFLHAALWRCSNTCAFFNGDAYGDAYCGCPHMWCCQALVPLRAW